MSNFRRHPFYNWISENKYEKLNKFEYKTQSKDYLGRNYPASKYIHKTYAYAWTIQKNK